VVNRIGILAAFASGATGEEAEEALEALGGFSHELIHEHEEAAEGFMIGIWSLSALALIGFVLLLRNHAKANSTCTPRLEPSNACHSSTTTISNSESR